MDHYLDENKNEVVDYERTSNYTWYFVFEESISAKLNWT